MAVKNLSVIAKRDGVRVTVRAEIITEPGSLVMSELDHLRAKLGSAIMFALADAPHLHVEVSEMKVKLR